MNQYKFRGISTVTNNWVYGCLLVRTDSLGELMLIEVQDKEPPFEIETFQVKPETVGMFSSKRDSQQVDVYHGDIVQGGNGKMWEVIYSLKACAWIISNKRIKDNGRNKFAGDEEYTFDRYRQLCKSANTDTFKKIGNVFDNPELVNPASGNTGINNMFDPNTQQATNEEVKAESQEIAAVEQEAQEQALESGEEGTTEG